MTNRRDLMTAAFAGLGAAVLGGGLFHRDRAFASKGTFPMAMSNDEWRKRLSPAQFYILREEGTESPFSSPLNNEHRKGTFACAACSKRLFSSETKFDSGTGWPSFYQPIQGAVGESSDRSIGMERTEVHCANCGGHLGHVFEDGPKPTGLRYCMNGVAMKFQSA